MQKDAKLIIFNSSLRRKLCNSFDISARIHGSAHFTDKSSAKLSFQIENDGYGHHNYRTMIRKGNQGDFLNRNLKFCRPTFSDRNEQQKTFCGRFVLVLHQ